MSSVFETAVTPALPSPHGPHPLPPGRGCHPHLRLQQARCARAGAHAPVRRVRVPAPDRLAPEAHGSPGPANHPPLLPDHPGPERHSHGGVAGAGGIGHDHHHALGQAGPGVRASMLFPQLHAMLVFANGISNQCRACQCVSPAVVSAGPSVTLLSFNFRLEVVALYYSLALKSQ